MAIRALARPESGHRVQHPHLHLVMRDPFQRERTAAAQRQRRGDAALLVSLAVAARVSGAAAARSTRRHSRCGAVNDGISPISGVDHRHSPSVSLAFPGDDHRHGAGLRVGAGHQPGIAPTAASRSEVQQGLERPVLGAVEQQTVADHHPLQLRRRHRLIGGIRIVAQPATPSSRAGRSCAAPHAQAFRSRNSACSPNRLASPDEPPPRRALAGLVHRQPLLHPVALLAAQREEVADRAGMDVRRLVPGPAQTEVIGMRPLQSSCQRTCQWPKFGKLTIARSPMRSICRSTSRGRSTACSVRDSTT